MLTVGTFLIEGLGSTRSQIEETATTVEEAGFDGIFVGENHVPEEGVPLDRQGAWGFTSAPLVLCMALLALSKRLKVGTSVLALPLHHAMEVAKEAATLATLSEGRFILGVGTGMETNGFAEYGIPYVNRISLLEEGIELMRRAWSEETFALAGRRYSVKHGTLNLRPPGGTTIPVWLAARSEAGAKRAARIGNGIVIDGATTLQEAQDLVGIYTSMCEKRETTPYVAIMRDICIGGSAVEARKKYERAVLERIRLYWHWNYLNERYDPWVKKIRDEAEVTWELSTRNRMIIGNPDECIDEIDRCQEIAGVSYIMLEFLLPAGGRTQLLEDIRLAGRSILPHLSK